MKLFLKTILFLLPLFIFENIAYTLSDYEIKKLCQNKSRRSTCIRNLKLKNQTLLQGNQIKIPVIPFKK